MPTRQKMPYILLVSIHGLVRGTNLELGRDADTGRQIKDPNHGEAAAEKLAGFFRRCESEPAYWQQISDGGMERVESRYTWKRYAEHMMTLSRIYGFWKYVSDLERSETQRYLQILYGLQFRPLAMQLLPGRK